MKKFILIFIAMLLSIGLFGQEQKPIEFMGIPVDGTEANMRSRLIAKGFKYNTVTDEYSGEFNGEDVTLAVVSNKGKVWRICVLYCERETQSQIKHEFNTLLKQFRQNGKYLWVFGEEIPSDEYLYKYKMEEQEYKFSAYTNLYASSHVWGIITMNYGLYSIMLFYDNEENMADGEDL